MTLHDLQLEFNAVDLDSNGSISRHEFAQMLFTHGFDDAQALEETNKYFLALGKTDEADEVTFCVRSLVMLIAFRFIIYPSNMLSLVFLSSLYCIIPLLLTVDRFLFFSFLTFVLSRAPWFIRRTFTTGTCASSGSGPWVG